MPATGPLDRLAMLGSHLQIRDRTSASPEFPMLLKHERDQYDGKQYYSQLRSVMEDARLLERIEAQRRVSERVPFSSVPLIRSSCNSTSCSAHSEVLETEGRTKTIQTLERSLGKETGGHTTIFSNRTGENRLKTIEKILTDSELKIFYFENISSDLKVLEETVEKQELDVIIIEYVDRTSGKIRDIKESVTKIQKITKCLIILDATEVFGVEEIKFDDWNIDLLLTSLPGSTSTAVMVSETGNKLFTNLSDNFEDQFKGLEPTHSEFNDFFEACFGIDYKAPSLADVQKTLSKRIDEIRSLKSRLEKVLEERNYSIEKGASNNTIRIVGTSELDGLESIDDNIYIGYHEEFTTVKFKVHQEGLDFLKEHFETI